MRIVIKRCFNIKISIMMKVTNDSGRNNYCKMIMLSEISADADDSGQW